MAGNQQTTAAGSGFAAAWRQAWSGLRARRWYVVAGTLIAGALLYYLSSGSNDTQYVTQPATRGAVRQSVSATGYVNPVLTITVGTYVSGVIQGIFCDYNTRVHKGQLCAKIDPRPYQTAVDQDRASLATAKAQLLKDQANLDYARVARDRYLKLYAAKAASRDTLDAARNNYAQAVAQVALDRASITQHQAALDAALVNLGYTDIVSPVDGTVVSRNVTVGQTVAASFQTPTLFLIAADLSQMQVDTNVSESDIGALRLGARALFTVEAYPDTVFAGLVTQIRQAPQTVQNVVTYDVVITVDNPKFQLKPGMTATVRVISAERRDVLRVPNQALRYSPGGISEDSASPAHVWILRDGKPEKVIVQTGLQDDGNTEVTGGALRPGDRVVVSERSGGTTKQQQSTLRPRF